MREQRFLQALHHQQTIRPKRVLGEKRLVFAGRSISRSQADPVDELSRDRIFHRRFHFIEAAHVMRANGSHPVADKAEIVFRPGKVQNRRHRRVKAREIVLFLRRNLRGGALRQVFRERGRRLGRKPRDTGRKCHRRGPSPRNTVNFPCRVERHDGRPYFYTAPFGFTLR